VLGEVFRVGLTRSAGARLSATLSGGQAQAVIARTPGLSPVVHRTFATGLDFAALVAAGLGAVAAIVVFVLARPRTQAGLPATSGSAAAELGRAEPDPASTGA
jgi:preprotein translocase subunit SecG